MKRSGLILIASFLFALALAACEADHDKTRTVTWAGMYPFVNHDLYFTTEALPGDPFYDEEGYTVRTILVQNDGTARYSYDYVGPTIALAVYYYVDGSGNGQCDELDNRDARGMKQVAEGVANIEIEFVDSSLAPEGVCEHFGSVVAEAVSTPTSAVMPSPQATPTATPGPGYAELYRDEAIAAVERWHDALYRAAKAYGEQGDLDLLFAAVTEGSRHTAEHTFYARIADRVTFNQPDPWWERLTITGVQDITCTESRCELVLDIHQEFHSGVERDYTARGVLVSLENGEWKMTLKSGR